MTRAPRWVRVLTALAVLVVAGVAAVVSFVHMQHLAEEAGEGWRANILPLSVDGLLVAASLVIYVRRRTGLRAGWLPWSGLLLGVAASVVANIAAAESTVLGRIVAAWPPVAFALSFELLVTMLRDSSGEDPSAPAVWAVDELTELPEGDGTPDRTAELIAAGAGRRKLARELEISEHQARQLLAERNGAGS